MTTMVRDLPADERPREKLIDYGASQLSDVELLAILLRTGTRNHSVIHLAEEILARFQGKGIAAITQMLPEEIAEINGIGLAKAATVIAAVELGRRIATKAAANLDSVYSGGDVAAIFMPRLRYEMKEHFILVLLDMKNHIISTPTISVGSLSNSVVHPREVFSEAIRRSAGGIILVHNHPSGDPEPSGDDIALTRRLVAASKILGIPIVDHVIIGDNKFVSLEEKGMLI
ncbi:MAG: DNA repair protein RadC [Schwartzia sp.]|nr:DNA repair protein RadC [Schwartzia sp. (in: firmicutes)]